LGRRDEEKRAPRKRRREESVVQEKEGVPAKKEKKVKGEIRRKERGTSGRKNTYKETQLAKGE